MLRWKNYAFTPSWQAILATLILLPLLIALGFWQLDRAAQKQQTAALYALRTHTAPIDLNSAQKISGDLNFFPAQLTGHFDNKHSALLDNQFYQHQLGYQVLTPFILKNNHRVVLINRGWVAQSKTRTQPPQIPAVNGTVTVRGLIKVPDSKTFSLDSQLENTHWPLRLETITLSRMNAVTGYHFMPFIILLDINQSYGFTRDWAPINSKIAMHYGYAFQWFALALTLLIIFIAVNLKKTHDS